MRDANDDELVVVRRAELDDLRATVAAMADRVRSLEARSLEARSLEARSLDARSLDAPTDGPTASPTGRSAGRPMASPEVELAPARGALPDDGPHARVDRRRALKAGFGALGAAAAGAVLFDASPAAATDGQALVLSTPNQLASGVTSILVASSTHSADYGFGVFDQDTGDGLLRNKAALRLWAQATNFDAGLLIVAGHSANAIHVETQGAGYGMKIDAAAGPGILIGGTTISPAVSATTTTGNTFQANSTSGSGLQATATTGKGVDATSTSGIGVSGTSSSQPGVSGTSSSKEGVLGTSTSGTGVSGTSTSGIGVHGTSTSQVGVSATSTNYIGLFANGGAAGVQAYSQNGYGLYATSGSAGGALVSGGSYDLKIPATSGRAAPATDAFAHDVGELVMDEDGNLWMTTVAGSGASTNRFRKVVGPATAGAFHILPTPVRVYDSRPTTNPSQGPKTKLSGNAARTIDCTVNSSGVPAGATAVALTVLLVNAADASGNLTIWANGATKPSSNTAVWGTGSGRYTTSTISALDASGKLQAAASASTDLVIDVVGYYR